MTVSLGDGEEIPAATIATGLSYASQPVVGTMTKPGAPDIPLTS
jgi:hypothetical protein